MRYYASIREALGVGEAAELPAGGNVSSLRAQLVAGGGAHAEVLGADRAVRTARNRKLCPESEALEEGDEVAFFPPVTGG